MIRALAVVLLMVSCSKPVPPATSSTPPPPAQSSATTAEGPRITMPDGSLFRVEVVADDELRAQGLMFRDHLRPNWGMLFVFPEDGEYSFWMKNTLIPLDMIWIDVNHNIVHVKHDVPPCKVDDCPSYAPGVAARYVLELAAGEAKKHGLKAGDRLDFAGMEHIVTR